MLTPSLRSGIRVMGETPNKLTPHYVRDKNGDNLTPSLCSGIRMSPSTQCAARNEKKKNKDEQTTKDSVEEKEKI